MYIKHKANEFIVGEWWTRVQREPHTRQLNIIIEIKLNVVQFMLLSGCVLRCLPKKSPKINVSHIYACMHACIHTRHMEKDGLAVTHKKQHKTQFSSQCAILLLSSSSSRMYHL
jgi:biotin carboxylase